MSAFKPVPFVELGIPGGRTVRYKIRAQSFRGCSQCAADDLLHFALVQVNARSKHGPKLEFTLQTSRSNAQASRHGLEFLRNSRQSPANSVGRDSNAAVRARPFQFNLSGKNISATLAAMLDLEQLTELIEKHRAAARAQVKEFSIGTRQFAFNSSPFIMGVINLSPDSWYRESVCLSAESAIARAKV